MLLCCIKEHIYYCCYQTEIYHNNIFHLTTMLFDIHFTKVKCFSKIYYNIGKEVVYHYINISPLFSFSLFFQEGLGEMPCSKKRKDVIRH